MASCTNATHCPWFLKPGEVAPAAVLALVLRGRDGRGVDDRHAAGLYDGLRRERIGEGRQPRGRAGRGAARREELEPQDLVRRRRPPSLNATRKPAPVCGPLVIRKPVVANVPDTFMQVAVASKLNSGAAGLSVLTCSEPVGFSPLGPPATEIAKLMLTRVRVPEPVTESPVGTCPPAGAANSANASPARPSETLRLTGHSFRPSPVPSTAWPTTAEGPGQSASRGRGAHTRVPGSIFAPLRLAGLGSSSEL